MSNNNGNGTRPDLEDARAEIRATMSRLKLLAKKNAKDTKFFRLQKRLTELCEENPI